jgi:uncharacterized membrane protein YhaH (DUF805 family)
VRQALANLLSVKGRISRRTWWKLFLCITVVQIIVTLASTLLAGRPLKHGDYGLEYLIVLASSLLFCWPWGTVATRRLHDVGLSGRWVVLLYVYSVVDLCFRVAAGWYTPGHAKVTYASMGLTGHVLQAASVLSGALYFVVLGLVPGQQRANRYGDKPRSRAKEADVFD